LQKYLVILDLIEDLIPAQGRNDRFEKIQTMKKSATLQPSSFVPLVVVEIIIGSLLLVLSFIFFIKLSSYVLDKSIFVFDQAVSQDVYALRSPMLTRLMYVISFLGGSVWLLGGSIAVCTALLFKNYRREAVLFLLTFSVGVLLNLLLKDAVARARPDIAPLTQEVFYSYPSGHSMNALVFYGLLTYLVYRVSRNLTLSMLVGLGSSLLVLAIGISRVYLGVHYPSDVIAGYLAGAGWILTVLVLQRTIRVYHYFKAKKYAKTHDKISS